MAQARNPIPLIEEKGTFVLSNTYNLLTMNDNYSMERLERHSLLQNVLKTLYNEGAKIINQSPLLLSQYYQIPEINTKNGRQKGKNPLQIYFIIKTSLDKLERPMAHYKLAATFKKIIANMTVGTSSVNFPNGSILLSDRVIHDILYFYMKSNFLFFKKEDVVVFFNEDDIALAISYAVMLGGSIKGDELSDLLAKLFDYHQDGVSSYIELAKVVYPDQMTNDANSNQISAMVESPATINQTSALVSVVSLFTSIFSPQSGSLIEAEKGSSLFTQSKRQ